VSQDAGRVRIDKWLWAARFYKTRSLATEAVDGGKVHVNGDRVKAARPLKAGDRLRIRRGDEELEVLVRDVSEHRGPATVAQTLYEETADSVARRQLEADRRRAFATAMPPRPAGRPDKKSRRDIQRMNRRG
jgi:ribosome-associated heat shock protein Hsp15